MAKTADFIELDDGKIYRKALYLMVKTHGFPVNFPLNQSSEYFEIRILSETPRNSHDL